MTTTSGPVSPPRSRSSAPLRPRPEALPDDTREAIRTALDKAARAVRENVDAWRLQATGTAEAEQVLDRLKDFVVGGPVHDDGEAVDCGSVASLALRLNELLRQELLRDSRGLDENALLDALRRLEECRLRLEPAEQEITYLLTGANALDLVVEFAHDLRSPLTSIMFLAETMRKGQSGEINDLQRGQLGIVYSAALGMVEVANDLMDLARSETDESWASSNRESLSIQEVIKSVRNTVAPMAEQKRLDIGFATPGHDTRKGHPVLLSRVLLNLMTNAIKFTDSGRVDVVAEETTGDTVRFSVVDTGRGMGQEELDKLYALFYRSDSSTGYHFSGTGLGLSICKRMVRLMNATLHVESERGEGTRFWFDLEMPRA